MVPVPWLAGLLVVASLVNWLRKRSWAERVRGPGLYAAIGAAAGLIGLGLAIVIATPMVERFTEQAVQWSMYPIVRGSARAFVMVSILVLAGTVASELVFRGWAVELARDWTRSGTVAIVMAGLIEGLLVEGDATIKLGAGVFGVGLGAMYNASGRSVVAPMCARLAFSLGALLLETLRVVG